MYLNPLAWSFPFDNMTTDIYLTHQNRMVEWWNAHDNGSRPLTNICFGTICSQKTASYTITNGDHVLLVDSTAGIITVTLPTSIGLNGRRYTIKDWKGQSGTNNITIATSLTQTIDGSSTKVLNFAYVSYTVVSDGTNWAII